MSGRQIAEASGEKLTATQEGLRALIKLGMVTTKSGPRNATLHWRISV
jgi:hypothetical protein